MNFSFKCRFCKNKNFQSLFSLGKISYTGKFPNSIKKEIPKSKIELVICNKCKLTAVVNYNEGISNCKKCNNYIDFSEIKIPYAYKLLTQELESMSIAPRLMVK